MKGEIKEKIQYTLATVSIVFGIVLTFMGFWVEPTGEVDGTVLGVLGECFSFGGAVFGISLHYSNELRKFKDEARKHIHESFDSEEGEEDV